MSSPGDNHPIIVGVGQHTVRNGDSEGALEPMEIMALAARRAEEDAETRGLLRRVDSVRVANILSWRYADPAGLLAERTGASPREKLYTAMGGYTPQWLANETAEQIARGEVGVALLAGAEAVCTTRRARQQGLSLPWTPPAQGQPEMVGDPRLGSRDIEIQHGAAVPVQIYPLFENALRAARGRTLDEHQRRLGQLCASLARVAADNPYAWFRDGKSAEEIATVSADNRLVGFPYTKYMNAIIDVDQGAALIMTSAGEARRLGIPQSKWVYLLGGADATDLWYWSDRVNFCTSPALQRCGQRALDEAGLTIDQVDYFDLYSCFPVAVEIGCDMLGIAEDGPRPLTVTGGLAYFGGPGSNYSMHAIAAMVEHLRARPGTTGLVSAMGWYLTKHAVGVYGTSPKEGDWHRPDLTADQQKLDAMPHPELIERAEGPATIETYTVMHDREGRPTYSIVVGRLEDGRRFIANSEPDAAALQEMTQREMVGAGGRVHHDDASSKNVFAF